GAPRQLVLDVRMKVLLDSLIGLFVIALQRQEVVAFLGSDLTCDGRLAAHGIHGHHTPFEGEQLEEFWNRGDRIRLAVRLQLAHDKTAVLRTPSRDHMQGGGGGSPIKGGSDRFAVERDKSALRESRNRTGP